jgi:uncharacterized protein (DUF2235 family)
LIGAVGAGVSANVRSAYAFLAHNYDKGDEIYFFGFSRGAYTARAIAGMVTEVGLLTKRGMDRFNDLYGAYHKLRLSGKPSDPSTRIDIDKLIADKLLDMDAAEAVQIIGVWDTVAFHQTRWAKWFGYDETIEFTDTNLSPNVKYGFHAVALDERREPFLPVLWELAAQAPLHTRTVEMKQVWFSGRHTDIGGGDDSHYLSDISFAWMIAECSKTGLLEFDNSYCLKQNKAQSTVWDTCKGTTYRWATDTWYNKILFALDKLTFGHILVNRKPLSLKANTNESIHESVKDRNLSQSGGYPCNLLTGVNGTEGWQLVWDKAKSLPVASVLQLENEYKGNIRPATE